MSPPGRGPDFSLFVVCDCLRESPHWARDSPSGKVSGLTEVNFEKRFPPFRGFRNDATTYTGRGCTSVNKSRVLTHILRWSIAHLRHPTGDLPLPGGGSPQAPGSAAFSSELVLKRVITTLFEGNAPTQAAVSAFKIGGTLSAPAAATVGLNAY